MPHPMVSLFGTPTPKHERDSITVSRYPRNPCPNGTEQNSNVDRKGVVRLGETRSVRVARFVCTLLLRLFFSCYCKRLVNISESTVS